MAARAIEIKAIGQKNKLLFPDFFPHLRIRKSAENMMRAGDALPRIKLKRETITQASVETMHSPPRIIFCLNRGPRQKKSPCRTTATVRYLKLQGGEGLGGAVNPQTGRGQSPDEGSGGEAPKSPGVFDLLTS